MLAFEVAHEADDAAIRRLLRDNPMDGDIRVAFTREPSSALAATIAGDVEQTVVGRDVDSGRVVAMGCRAVLPAYVNGTVRPLGYLSQLKVDRARRGGRHLLVTGYRAVRALHACGDAPFYVTTILEDNRPARRLLEAGLSGLPTYRPVESLVTLVMPVRRRRNGRRPGVGVERGRAGVESDVATCLQRNLPRYQFAPHWTRDDLASSTRTRGLWPEDFMVTRREGRIVGCLARWDQRGFKQAVVHGYSRRLRAVRPLVNTLAPLLRTPRLPRAGSVLRNAFVSHLAVDEDNPEVARALLDAVLRDSLHHGLEYLTLTLATRHALVPMIRRAFPHRAYPSVLYVVYWEDGEAAAARVDDRVPQLEAALL